MELIDRQAAIAKLKKHREIFCKNRLEFAILSDKDKTRVDEIDACIAALINLSSAQPTPKTVIYSGDGYADGYMVYDSAECPECGYEYEESDKAWGEPYCPHCGQLLNWNTEGEPMEGGTDGTTD